MAYNNATDFKAIDLGITAGNHLRLPRLTTANRPDDGNVGTMYYDMTLGQVRAYQASGWTAVDGTAAGSLDAAYNGGQTVTVDAADVLFNLNDATNDYKITIDNATNATIDDGFTITTLGGAASVLTDAIDLSDAGIVNAINVGANTILGTTAVINFTNFDVAGTGNTTVGGTLAVTGATTLSAAATFSAAVTMDSTAVIDVSNAEALLIRQNGDVGDILTVDTTNDAADNTLVLASGTTTGTAIQINASTTTGNAVEINADSATSGNGLLISVASGTMTATGAAISVIDSSNADVEIFAVRDDGSILSLTGTAEGTTALGVTTGDVLITDGDLTLSGGEMSVTGDDNTGETMQVTNNTATTFGAATSGVMEIRSTTLTTGTLLNLELTEGTLNGGAYLRAYDVTGGAQVFAVKEDGEVEIAGAGGSDMLTITAGDVVLSDSSLTITDADSATTLSVTNNTFTTQDGVSLSGTAQTTGNVVAATGGGANLASGGSVFLATMGAAIAGSGFEAVTTGVYTGSNGVFALTANSATTGDLFVASATGQTSGNVMSITGGGANLATGGALIRANMGAATAGSGVEIVSTGAYTGSDGLISVTGNSLTTGDMIAVSGTAQTSGNLLTMTGGGAALATGGSMIRLNMGAATAGSALEIVTTGVYTGSDGLINFIADSATTGTLGIISADGLTTGTVLDISSTGTIVTTGDILNIVANTATTSTGLVRVSGTGLTDGFAMLLTGGGANVTASGGVLDVVGGAATTGAMLRVATTGVYTGTVGVVDINAASATEGDIVVIGGTGLTTGSALRINTTTATLTTGFYIECNDGAASDFTVADDGATVIAGNAGGTAALTVTAGDLFLSDTDTTIIESENGTTDVVLLDNKAGVQADNTALLKLDAGGNNASGSNILRIAPTGVPVEGSIGMEFVGAGLVMQALNIDSDSATNSSNVFNGGGAIAANQAVVSITADGTPAAATSAVLRAAFSGTDTNTPTVAYFTSSGTGDILVLESTSDGTTGPVLHFAHIPPVTGQANSDVVGRILFDGEDDAGAIESYGRIDVVVTDVTAANPDSNMNFYVDVAGTLTQRLQVQTVANAIAVGSGAAAAIVSSAGNNDVTLQTGNATTGTITIVDGANGDITVSPNGTGASLIEAAAIQWNNRVIAAATAADSPDNTDGIITMSTDGAQALTVTLPEAASNLGLEYTFQFDTDGGQNITINRTGADVIDDTADLGNTSITMQDAGDFIIIRAVSADRWIVVKNAGCTLT